VPPSKRPPTPEPDPAAGRAPMVAASRRRVPKTSEIVARELADHIITAELADGTVLPPEREMMEALGVGRTTLREALRLLESRGALTIKAGPRGGPVVRQPAPSDLGQALTMILQFETATANDLMTARVSLEPAVARAAAQGITPEQVAELRAANEAMLDAIEDEDDFVEANRRFHEILARASGNVVLEMFTRSLMTIADGRAVGTSYSPKARAGVHAAHEQVIATVAAGDPDAAEQAMLDHLEEARRHWHRRHPDLADQPVRWSG
jgi:DNA-binding FadR family transcriptional regulator